MFRIIEVIKRNVTLPHSFPTTIRWNNHRQHDRVSTLELHFRLVLVPAWISAPNPQRTVAPCVGPKMVSSSVNKVVGFTHWFDNAMESLPRVRKEQWRRASEQGLSATDSGAVRRSKGCLIIRQQSRWFHASVR